MGFNTSCGGNFFVSANKFSLFKIRLSTANLRLVASVARKEYGESVVLSAHDLLLQEGVIGMIKAIGKFDDSYGNRFSTYATPGYGKL